MHVCILEYVVKAKYKHLQTSITEFKRKVHVNCIYSSPRLYIPIQINTARPTYTFQYRINAVYVLFLT